MKFKDIIGSLVLLGITLLLQALTAYFQSWGWLSIPLTLLVMALCGLPFLIWLPVEIYSAWLNLRQRRLIIPLIIPAALASVLLLNPLYRMYGSVVGGTLVFTVSFLGSILFWTAAILPTAVVVCFLESNLFERANSISNPPCRPDVTAQVLNSTEKIAGKPANPYLH